MTVDQIVGVTLTTLTFHADDRGGLAEVFRASNYPERFVQANHSRSRRNVLRGLHYHRRQLDRCRPPH